MGIGGRLPYLSWQIMFAIAQWVKFFRFKFSWKKCSNSMSPGVRQQTLWIKNKHCGLKTKVPKENSILAACDSKMAASLFNCSQFSPIYIAWCKKGVWTTLRTLPRVDLREAESFTRQNHARTRRLFEFRRAVFHVSVNSPLLDGLRYSVLDVLTRTFNEKHTKNK